MKTVKVALVLATVLMLSIGVHSTVYAGSLSLDDGLGNVVVVNDNSADDADPTTGVIIFSGAVGPNWTIDVTTGITKPAAGSAAVPVMDLNSINMSLGTANIKIKFSDVNFTGVGSAVFGVGGTIAVGGGLSAEAFYSGTNALFSETLPIGTQLSFGAGPFSGQTSGSIDPAFLGSAGLYSLTLEVDIAHAAGGGLSSFNANLTAVPEPTTILLLGFGLVGFFGLRRRVTE